MRKFIILLAGILIVMGASGCSRQAEASKSEPSVEEPSVTEPSAEEPSVAEPSEAAPSETEQPTVQESQETPEKQEGNRLTVSDEFEVSGIKDADAAGLFKDFLLGSETAEYNGDKASLGDLLMKSIDEYGYDSESGTMTEYINGNYAVHFAASEASESTLYVEIMNVMVGGTVYQIRIKNNALYINSVLNTGWSDSVSVYTNGIIGIYHGMHLPMVDYYFDATDSLMDIYDGSSRAKLLIFGPKSYFDTGYEEALSEYQEQAENVLVFDEEMTDEITAKRDKLLGISDNDAIEWTKLEIKDFS
ncbi:MAG: hypothetical protein IK139_06540 [Lachnospiraceae bacterium]|nr:hypothetical protein [Lachnospiraceae bacterium]